MTSHDLVFGKRVLTHYETLAVNYTRAIKMSGKIRIGIVTLASQAVSQVQKSFRESSSGLTFPVLQKEYEDVTAYCEENKLDTPQSCIINLIVNWKTEAELVAAIQLLHNLKIKQLGEVQ